MNELQVVQGFGAKVYGTVTDPLFLAKEVAEVIEHSDSNKMIRGIDEDEKVRNIVPTPGGEQDMWFLTEDGLYEVLMTSRKPIAKRFKKIVKQILKKIRIDDMNSYMPQTLDQQIALLANGHGDLRQDVDDLKQRFGLPASQANQLETIRKKHIVMLLGGKESNAYRKLGKKVFAQIGRDFKERFDLPRYDALPMNKFDEAVDYLKCWQLPTNLGLEVRELNSQMSLEV